MDQAPLSISRRDRHKRGLRSTAHVLEAEGLLGAVLLVLDEGADPVTVSLSHGL